MKPYVLFCLTTLLLSGCSDHGGKMIGGVFFACARDPDRTQHFQGLPGRDVVEQEAQRAANDFCEAEMGGVALDIIYVYKDGSQKVAHPGH